MRLRIRVMPPRLRKPFPNPPSKKEGGGAPISASTRVRPAAGRQSLPARAARALPLFPPPLAGQDQGGGALAFRRSTAARSAPGRASWNHRIQTGGPSPAPVQRAPRSPITCRTERCPEPPGADRNAAPGDRSRSTFESTLAKGPSVNEMGSSVTSFGDRCQDAVSEKVTNKTGQANSLKPSSVVFGAKQT